MPRERPILFRPELVRAILDGRKNQTRRVVRPQPADGDRSSTRSCIGPGDHLHICPGIRCPYGFAGDRLWVRETWRVSPSGETSPYSPEHCHYRADADEPAADGCWRPSIHMPRWACRLVLEVTGVRVERLQAIDEIGARDEGVEPVAAGDGPGVITTAGNISYRKAFAQGWDRINGPRGYGWDANPWVWVIAFRVAEVRG